MTIEPFVPCVDYIRMGNPAFPEHDDRGFRNSVSILRCRHVFIGDSHTYGSEVPADSTWAALIGAIHGVDVYTAAIPGWGIWQYHLTFRQLPNKAGRSVVFCIYPGNDLAECFAHTKATASSLRRELWKTEWDDILPVDMKSTRIKNQYLSRWMSETGCSYREAVLRGMEEGIAECDAMELDGKTYVLTPQRRFECLNPDDPAIRAAYTMVESFLRHVTNAVDYEGTRVSFVLLPSKEYAAFGQQGAVYARPEALAVSVAREQEARDRLKAIIESHGFVCEDLGALYRASFHQGIYPPETDDGHLNVVGCRLVADHLYKNHIKSDVVFPSSVYPLC